MRLAENERKEFQPRIPLILDLGEKIPKKKTAKKFKKLRDNFLTLLLAKLGMIQAEKESKGFQNRIPLILDPGEKIPKKKTAKEFKKLKNDFPALFLAKTG